MDRTIHISKDFKDAEKWDIYQHISMTSEERQNTAKILREKYYGRDVPDVRESISKL